MSKTMTIVYGGQYYFSGRNGKSKTYSQWFEIADEKHGSEYYPILSQALNFTPSQSSTASVPVGMVCEIEVEGTQYSFGEMKRLGMITEQGYQKLDMQTGDGGRTLYESIDEWLEYRRMKDVSAKQERSMKIAQNKMDRELGDEWMNMAVKDVLIYVQQMEGVKKVNMMALVMRKMGL